MEFLLGKVTELVDSHGVGLTVAGVVGVDGGKVFKENALPVGVLELGGVGDTMLGLPGVKLRDGGSSLSVQKNSSCTEECNEHCNLLSVHEKDYFPNKILQH